MAKPGKRMRAITEKIDRERDYAIDEAVGLLNECAKTKFKESFDISVNLGIDPRKSDQVVRGATTLPHGTGKSVRVAVFAQGDNADQAREAGADVVGFEDLAEKVKAGELDFDVVIATPDAMRVVGQLGRVLGPRGLMPNPKTGTVTMDIATAVQEIKAGKVEFRVDKGGVIHAPVGKLGFDADKLNENASTLISAVVRAKPSAAKGKYVKKISICSTMSPALEVEANDLIG